VSEWGTSVYGNPCRGCGFSWATGVDDALSLVSNLPGTYARVLAGASGHERHPELTWSVSAYVCHVGDNLRIWAERLAGIAAGGPPEVGGYDERVLADARNYERIPLPAALWSLSRCVPDWLDEVGRSPRTGIVLIHPERGGQSRTDVILSNAHDAFHHQWDIRRSLHFGDPTSAMGKHSTE
jgi:hypothetical protein